MSSRARGTKSKSTTPVPSPREGTFPRRLGTTASRSPAIHSNPRTPGNSDDESLPRQPPPVAFSPIKARQRRKDNDIKSLSDAAARAYTDEEIIEAAFAGLKSPAYRHFDISLDRSDDSDELVFVFTCMVDPENHAPHRRSRLKTSSGTKNLNDGIKACNARQGIVSTTLQQSGGHIPYSPANHRTLLALRCAKNMRPFNFVQDPLYIAEVNMLRSGTRLPDPTTVSRDVKLLYEQLSTHVSDYFKKLAPAIHLVVDGWTAPLMASFLGLVVVWCEKGVLHRIVLEFIRLKKKHTGQYLAQEIAGCLKRYGIAHLFFSLVMDNASNCNKTAEVLPNMISTFAGEEARVRCFSHILHLIAQMFMSFFFRKRKSSKKVKKNADGLDELIDVDEPDNGDEEDDAVALEEIEADDAELADDDGYLTHGKAVVYSMREEAIRYMEAEKAIFLDKKEINEALGIMPKVAGLARRIHDSGDLKERFDNLVSGDSTLDGSKRTLDRRVPTRWNSDHACLQAHQYFRTQVEQMTGLTGTKLRAYALSERQWKIADDLVDALRIFEEPTRLFSNASVPLIVNVIPAFDDLRLSLEGIRDDDDEENNISPVMRVAAHAALMMVDKYETMSWERPIYYVAIVMCPDRKMQWFKNRPAYDRRTLKYIKDLVIKYFEDKYQTSALPGAPTEEELRSRSQQKKNRFIRRVDEPMATTRNFYPADHIQTYLKEPPVQPSVIAQAGGYLKFWEIATITTPQLAKMGLHFVSTPASSVDAERAFSTGRRHVNFMQHNMTSNTFKSKVALGSWSDAPFFPKVQKLSEIIEKHSTGKTFEGFSDDDSDSD